MRRMPLPILAAATSLAALVLAVACNSPRAAPAMGLEIHDVSDLVHVEDFTACRFPLDPSPSQGDVGRFFPASPFAAPALATRTSAALAGRLGEVLEAACPGEVASLEGHRGQLLVVATPRAQVLLAARLRDLRR